MRVINKTVTWAINIIVKRGTFYSQKKPCHELKTPKEHKWALNISGGCDCGYHDSEARYECSHCYWGFDANDLVNALPVDSELFE
jgi:hypothetical protein